MAGQGFNRREAVKAFSIAAALSQAAVFERWVYAFEKEKRQSKPYQPKFFSKSEFATIVVLSDLIIPSDETPGAKEAGAAEFTDFIIFHDKDQQKPFRDGLAWFKARGFDAMPADEKIKFLERLSYKAKFRADEKQGQDFFHLLRTYTVMGYYTSRPGMEALGIPTLHHYAQMPECPHHDDPEHKKVKA